MDLIWIWFGSRSDLDLDFKFGLDPGSGYVLDPGSGSALDLDLGSDLDPRWIWFSVLIWI